MHDPSAPRTIHPLGFDGTSAPNGATDRIPHPPSPEFRPPGDPAHTSAARRPFRTATPRSARHRSATTIRRSTAWSADATIHPSGRSTVPTAATPTPTAQIEHLILRFRRKIGGPHGTPQ